MITDYTDPKAGNPYFTGGSGLSMPLGSYLRSYYEYDLVNPLTPFGHARRAGAGRALERSSSAERPSGTLYERINAVPAHAVAGEIAFFRSAGY